jgi:hypothetical protein
LLRWGAHSEAEVTAMTTMTRIRAKLTPWDDPDFVRAFEAARRDASETASGDGLHTAERVEHLLRARGYPNARVIVDRTVEEALEHTEHWIVSRDA